MASIMKTNKIKVPTRFVSESVRPSKLSSNSCDLPRLMGSIPFRKSFSLAGHAIFHEQPFPGEGFGANVDPAFGDDVFSPRYRLWLTRCFLVRFHQILANRPERFGS